MKNEDKGNYSNNTDQEKYVKYQYSKGMHIRFIGKINTNKLAEGLVELTRSRKL